MNKTSDNNFTPEFFERLSYQSPFFVFSKKRIRENIQEFKELFPGALLHYAMKANSEPEVLKLIADAGCGFEVASKYELHMLQKLKINPEKIVYGTAIKPASHIKEFFEYGVKTFAFDSSSELEKIAAIAPGSRVYVRLVVNDAGSVFKFSEKFGTDIENAVPLLLHAQELGLQPYGISFHVGSQASNLHAWANALESLEPAMKELKEKGIPLEMLNIGGGYPYPYASAESALSLQEIADVTLKQYKKLPYQPKLLLEPGRKLVADAGALLATVIARVERKEHTWLFLDAGCYNGLFEAMPYQGSTRYQIETTRLIKDEGEAMFALAGPTGDSQDVITREVLLPADMSVGDKVIIQNVGAYSLTVTSRFNGFPHPTVYFT